MNRLTDLNIPIIRIKVLNILKKTGDITGNTIRRYQYFINPKSVNKITDRYPIITDYQKDSKELQDIFKTPYRILYEKTELKDEEIPNNVKESEDE